MKIKTILSITFLSSVLVTTVQGNTLYIQGQAGAFNDLSSTFYHARKEFGFTARVAAGYAWDTVITFGKNSDTPRYLCLDYGLELGYHHYEDIHNSATYSFFSTTYTSDASYERRTTDLLGVINFKTPVHLDFFVKFGPALVTEKTRLNENTLDGDNLYWSIRNSRNYVPKLIIGTGYNLTRKFNMNLALTHEYRTNDVSHATTLMAGVKYNFA